MNDIVKTLVVLVLCCGSLSAQQFQSLSHSPFGGLALPPVALPTPHGAVVAGGGPLAAQMKTYGVDGFTFSSDAESAKNEAEAALKSLGVAVIASRVYRDASWTHGFTIEYIGGSFLDFESYTSGGYTFSSDAASAMEQTKANFRAAGYAVVLGVVKRDASWQHVYKIDYVRQGGGWHPRPRPDQGHGRVKVMESSTYRAQRQAEWAMGRKVHELKSQGALVLDASVIRVVGGYKFRIRFKGGR